MHMHTHRTCKDPHLYPFIYQVCRRAHTSQPLQSPPSRAAGQPLHVGGLSQRNACDRRTRQGLHSSKERATLPEAPALPREE